MSHFESSRMRIRWGNNDIVDLERRARLFFHRTKYTLRIEPEPDKVYEVHKIKLAKPIPEILTQRAVSAGENLRAALDLAIVEVGRLVGIADLEKLAFPFCAAEENFAARIASCCKGIPDEIIALLMSYKPYQGGEDFLWALNELCRASKHKLIVPTAASASVVFRDFEVFGSNLPVHLYEGEVSGSEDEVIIARTQPRTPHKYSVGISLSVAFGKVKVVKGEAVAPILKGMSEAVSLIVNEIEEECKGLGLFGRT